MHWNLKPLVVWGIALVGAALLGLVLVEFVTTDDRPPPTPSFGPP